MRTSLIREIIIYTACFLCANMGIAQKFNKSRLQEIKIEQENLIKKENVQLNKYLLDKKLSSRYLSLGDGRQAFLKNVIDGLPYYISTYNLQARKTTGVEFIQSADGLNLDLTGEGLTIGVWDGGQVFKDHIEFSGRITNKNGASFSNHATHVTGTITSAGINPQAKGMVPEAEIISYYAFEDDLGPMAIEAANGLILSNHSYGLVLGWSYDSESDSWDWLGGSGDVDERFGYYSSVSRTIDEITYNAPYYTIVWAAGNDRNDTGDGTKASDGPYDAIGPSAVSKNVITVGAITGFEEYTGTSSAVMSSFSSWGPTDDGRIKPDIVADGVNLLSTSSAGNESYTQLSGTSMASPNVTGTLAVLQQYYRQRADTFLTASALKSLIIHTAREAGSKDGPDANFGWGVLNAVDALKILRSDNTSDTLLVEHELLNGENYELEYFSDGEKPIVTTMAWTDLPGSTGAPGTTDIMLVNDLDLRIIDDEDNEVFPWILNPSNPLEALKGDNIRDNVEKIEFSTTQSRKYRIIVSHKGTLTGDKQRFSLTVTGGSIDVTPESEYYWISSSGELDDIPENWSNESGGNQLNSISLSGGSVIFDNNSGLEDSDVITLTNSLEIDNFIWLNTNAVTIDLNQNTLIVNRQLKIETSSLKFRNGTIIYKSDESTALALDFDGKDDVSFIVDNNVSLEIMSDIEISSFSITSGDVRISNRSISISSLEVMNDAILRLTNNNVNLSESVKVSTENFVSTGNQWAIEMIDFIAESNVLLDDEIIVNDRLNIIGVVDAKKVVNDGITDVDGIFNVDSLHLNEGSSMTLHQNATVNINKDWKLDSSEELTTSIEGETNDMSAMLSVNYRDLFCFDNLVVSNINFVSESIFNAGTNSSVTNVNNVKSLACDDIVYANFELLSNCANSVIEVEDLSIGTISNYNWDFVGGVHLLSIEESSPEVTYSNPGSYNLTLNIENSSISNTYEREVVIVENLMDEASIVENSSGLICTKQGESYQWYRNYMKLENQVERIFDPTESGTYQVAYFNTDNECKNRISSAYELSITDLSSDISLGDNINVFPIPFEGMISIEGLTANDEVTIFNSIGRTIYFTKSSSSVLSVNMSNYTSGVYMIKVVTGQRTNIKKIIKK